MYQHKFPFLRGVWFATTIGTLITGFSNLSNAQQVSPCRQLGKGNTVVIIEASNNERMQLVNQVISEHNLQGQFCTSRRTGRTVWMSNQLNNVDTAVKVFDYFKAVGLVSPINPERYNNLNREGIPSSPTPSSGGARI